MSYGKPKQKPQPKPAAMPTPEEWDRGTIRNAAMFVTFVALGPFDRRRQEFLVDNREPRRAYLDALEAAARLQEWLNASEVARRPLIYAVDKAGRQALVTTREAQVMGLLP